MHGECPCLEMAVPHRMPSCTGDAGGKYFDEAAEMIVTIWERLNDGKWEHNHYEEGWREDQLTPTPLHSNHVKSWAAAKWRAIKGELESGKLRHADQTNAPES